MPETAIARIHEHARAGTELRERFFKDKASRVDALALRMAFTLARGNSILICGNGGSAADCQHVAGELVNRFMLDRPPLSAIALTTDTSVLTAIGNDFSFEDIFAKQVQAIGRPGDLLLAISTSGNSPNILRALETARRQTLTTAGLTGSGGGKMAALCDLLVDVDHSHTPLVQEIHLAVEHLLCGLTDYYLFENVAALTPYLHEGKELP